MKIRTGLPGLDKMLKGGLLKGRTILLSGPSGSGKTTLAMHFVYSGAMESKEKALYVTLEESKDKLIEDMGKFGMDLNTALKSKRFFLLGGPIAQLTTSMKKVNADVANIIQEIEEVIRENNITRVVLDSVNPLTMLLKDDIERRQTLAQLSNTLSSLGCTSILLTETEEGSTKLSTYGMEEFIVDGVIILYLIRAGSRFVPGIGIRKMRGSDHDKEIRVYAIDKKGLTVYPNQTMFADL